VARRQAGFGDDLLAKALSKREILLHPEGGIRKAGRQEKIRFLLPAFLPSLFKHAESWSP
jgi:hypothetical protein